MVESIETGEGLWPTADEHFEAANFSLKSAVGLSLFDDFAGRIALLAPPVPFRLPTLNRLTGGGVARKTLNLIVAPTSGGKSMALCHLAADYVRAGLNVLYITLELSQEMIALRVAANLLQVGMEEIKRTPSDEVTSRLQRLRPAMGDMRVVYSPAFSTQVGDIYNVMNQMKVGRRPVDVLIVDYLNRCGVQGITKGMQVGSYQIAGTIATELHALAGQTDAIVWTATQTNREGYGKKNLDLSNTSESYMVNSAADLIIGITKPSEVPNRMILTVMKNRNGAVPEKGAMVAVDYSRMTLIELETAEDDVGEAMQKARKAMFATATTGRTRLVT
ncbi:MAG: AAA family ATPase [Bryobacterales bacterium]|nr:AAA family ATPase [Bryobacterales bacterium]